MKYLEAYKINSSEFLGTKVSLELLFVEEPASVAVSVFDPTGTEVVTDAVGVKATVGRYVTYSYASDLDNIGGRYKFRVQAVFNTEIYYYIFDFNLTDYNLE
jgi:hypothetical protein